MSNYPTILFSINNVPTTVSAKTVNPFFNGSGGINQPPNWYYYYIPNSGANQIINISVKAAEGYPLPALNFMLVGSGGLGGKGGEDGSDRSGGNGGGGGTGTVSLINNYFSGLTSTTHNVSLYPLGSSNSIMYLDVENANYEFTAYTGTAGYSGTSYVTTPVVKNGQNANSYSNGNSGNGGVGTYEIESVPIYPPALRRPPVNALPSYSGMIRGGAGGNGGQPLDDPSYPGTNYNYATGGGTGTDSIAYVPVTFADGLSSNVVSGGAGGLTSNPAPGGGPGSAANVSQFMLYFCL